MSARTPRKTVSAQVEMPEDTAREVLYRLIEKFCQRWDLAVTPLPDGHDHLESLLIDARVIHDMAKAIVTSALREQRYRISDEDH